MNAQIIEIILPDELCADLTAQARYESLTQQALIRKAIIQYLQGKYNNEQQ